MVKRPERAKVGDFEEAPPPASPAAIAYARRPAPRGWRELCLAGASGLLALGGLAHALYYPRTFNTRPPLGVRVDPTSPAALSRGDDPPRSAGAAAARARVAVVVIDGMRDDAVAWLGLEGATGRDGARAPITRCTATAAWPSYSRAAYATIGTGAVPALTGVHTNRFSGPVELDSVFVRARVAGLRVLAITDDVAWWGEMFPGGWDDHRAAGEPFRRITGALFHEETAEDPGAAPLPPPAPDGGDDRFDLALLHSVPADTAGHASGAQSDAYRAAVVAAGAWIRGALSRLDPARDTLVVVSDHGHLDRGGHGGPEPVIVRTPLVLAGRGVRALAPERCPPATSADLAPTVAALAGVAPPRHATGRALVELLDLPPDEIAAVEAIGRARRAALAAALGAPGADLGTALPRVRGPSLAGGAVAGAAFVGLLLGLLGIARGRATAVPPRGGRAEIVRSPLLFIRNILLACVYPVAAVAVIALIEPAISFSAVRVGAAQYAGRLVVLLAGPALLGLAAQLAAWRGARTEDPRDGRSTRALGVALAAAPWIFAMGFHGSPWAGPELGEPHLSFAVLFGASAATIGCGLVALLAVADAWRERRKSGAAAVR